MLGKAGEGVVWATSSIVFIILDFVDCFLCIFYGIVDKFLEGNGSPECYCHNREEKGASLNTERESEASETLYKRKNIFRELGLPVIWRKWLKSKESGGEVERGGVELVGRRWSDCGCEGCVSWMDNVHHRLHVVVKQPSKATTEDCKGQQPENVIFIHGFLSSSLFWTETIFQNLCESPDSNYRLFAVDLLGFGASPKPRDCFYTIKDHLDMIEKSVLFPHQMNSFHLVAHSMGCILAIALAARYPNLVKSITLVAPPCFPSSKGNASLVALTRLAERKVWPPLLFGSSVMSWYEHLGRCVCFLVCRNHRTWERILRFLTRKSDLPFMVIDLTRHTHHSAWHTMHNVICGGAKLMDEYLEILRNSNTKISVIQGDQDQVVPLECSDNVKLIVPEAQVHIIKNTDHSSVVLGRKEDFTLFLEQFWASANTETRNKEFCLRNGCT